MINLSRYIGIPFVPNGRSFSGVDCYGLVYLFMKNEFNTAIPILDGVYDEQDGARNDSMADLAVSTGWEPSERLERSIALFKIFGFPAHVGILLSKNRMLHAVIGHCSSIERYDSLKWNKRLYGVYSWDG